MFFSKWNGNSWREQDSLKKKDTNMILILEVFPQFFLEDKVVLLGESIDKIKRMSKPLVTKVYVRRQPDSNRNN